MEKLLTTCIYCKHPIDTTSDGWGYFQSGYDREYWHLECVEMEEE